MGEDKHAEKKEEESLKFSGQKLFNMKLLQ